MAQRAAAHEGRRVRFRCVHKAAWLVWPLLLLLEFHCGSSLWPGLYLPSWGVQSRPPMNPWAPRERGYGPCVHLVLDHLPELAGREAGLCWLPRTREGLAAVRVRAQRLADITPIIQKVDGLPLWGIGGIVD
jgi:hypothetical protein